MVAVSNIATFSLLYVLLFLSSGNDLPSYLDPVLYWQHKQIAPEAPALRKLLLEQQGGNEDLQAWARQLGAASPRDRREARQHLLAAGQVAIPVLTPLARAEDPEVAQGAGDLLAELRRQDPKRDPILRLMAIAELGRLKDREALPLLRACLNSPAPGEARYAARAIALIEGQPPPADPPPDLAALDRLVPLLPPDCEGVLRLGRVPGIPAEDMYKQLRQYMGELMGGRKPKIEEAHQGMNEDARSIAGKLGYVRLEGLVLGWSASREYGVLLLAGDFDERRFAAYLAGALAEEGEEDAFASAKLDELEYYQRDALELIVPLSSGRLALIASGKPDFPLAAWLATARGGNGGEPAAEPLRQLLAEVDRSGPVWAAVLLPDAAHKLWTPCTPFTRATLGSALKDGALWLRLEARGETGEALKGVLTEFPKLLDEWRQQAIALSRYPGMQAYADTLLSVKQEPAADRLVATARVPVAAAVLNPGAVLAFERLVQTP